MADSNTQSGQRYYNDPINGTDSSIGPSLEDFYYQKKALIEARREQYFTQLADVTAMPKNMGKTIKRFHYIPLLDDENINDEGLDGASAAILTTGYDVDVATVNCAPQHVEAAEASFAAAYVEGDYVYITDSTQWLEITGATAVEYDASTTGGANGTELSDAAVKALLDANSNSVTATVSGATITLTGTHMQFTAEADADIAVAILGGAIKAQNSGYLYGSSKDVGVISGKLPALTETGGRVNRVGFKRKELEAAITKFGFFDEYTQESMDFDSDADLMMHINREMVNGANEITEDALQIDLLNEAGVVRYPGVATADDELLKADGVVTYGDMLRLSITLDDNRTPKHTKVITGTRMIDTKTIPAARVMYIGSELMPAFEAMTDLHSERAFIPVQQYAAGTTTLTGEWGSVSNFRLVVVPEMMKWAGAGGDAVADAGESTYYATNGRYDVFPMLVVGDGSFTTIGFQTDGKTVKFKIMNKKPGMATADHHDPYGETGFMSIKWYYGFMTLRPERLAVIKTLATL